MRLDQREPLGWQRGTGSSFGSGQPPLGHRGTMFNQAREPTSHPSTLIRLDGRATLRQMSAIFTTFIFFPPPPTHPYPSVALKASSQAFLLYSTHVCTHPQKMPFNMHTVWLRPVFVALPDTLYRSGSWARVRDLQEIGTRN